MTRHTITYRKGQYGVLLSNVPLLFYLLSFCHYSTVLNGFRATSKSFKVLIDKNADYFYRGFIKKCLMDRVSDEVMRECLELKGNELKERFRMEWTKKHHGSSKYEWKIGLGINSSQKYKEICTDCGEQVGLRQVRIERVLDGEHFDFICWECAIKVIPKYYKSQYDFAGYQSLDPKGRSLVSQHFFEQEEERRPKDEVIHSCNECYKPIIGVERYHCTHCESYDACSTCYNKSQSVKTRSRESHEHPLTKIEEFIKFYCTDCEKPLDLAFLHCMICHPSVDLCTTCYRKSARSSKRRHPHTLFSYVGKSKSLPHLSNGDEIIHLNPPLESVESKVEDSSSTRKRKATDIYVPMQQKKIRHAHLLQESRLKGLANDFCSEQNIFFQQWFPKR